MSLLTITINDEEQAKLRNHAALTGATEEEVLLSLIRSLPVDETLTNQPEDELDLIARISVIMRRVPKEELDRIPPDLSENLDHYLYGSPRK